MFTASAILKHKYSSPSGIAAYLLFQPEETFSFTEGQFVMIHAEINGKLVKKAYSICTTNKQLQEEKLFGVIVKKTSEAGMSDFLTQKVLINQSIIIKGPVGHYIDPGKHSNYLLISVGSGLSPNFGLFQQLSKQLADNSSLIHLIGERYMKDLIPETVTMMTGNDRPNISTRFFLTQEIDLPDGYTRGRVQLGVAQAIETLGINTTCFICGNPIAVTEITAQLEQLGIAREDIIVEKY